ncbi:hypothetical protein SDC9_200812 [bioreactor metagenome]|uniref:Uncharacterized protein n=1 Tax=bioreactor metagenome TaxID=1076179 RepID=A0A645IP87_9ZZZZ
MKKAQNLLKLCYLGPCSLYLCLFTLSDQSGTDKSRKETNDHNDDHYFYQSKATPFINEFFRFHKNLPVPFVM